MLQHCSFSLDLTVTWAHFDLHLWAEVNSDKKKEEAERQDACTLHIC
jgi:hypothetical protein